MLTPDQREQREADAARYGDGEEGEQAESSDSEPSDSLRAATPADKTASNGAAPENDEDDFNDTR